MSRISLDFETYSPVNLTDLGAYKYAEHPETEVLVVSVKKHDSDEILTWDARQDWSPALDLLRQAIEERWEIHAFNAQFEWAILKYVCPVQFGFPVPDINTMRCTAAVCRSAGLPSSLAKAADFLSLEIRKDTAGKALIRTFSIPKKGGTRIRWNTEGQVTIAGERVTHAEAFQMFVDYCAQDVRTEVAVAERMGSYELKGFPLEWFLLDMRLNDRGVPVDVPALEAARDLYMEKEAELSGRFTKITGLSHTQRDRCYEWFKEHGYSRPSLDKNDRKLALDHGGLSEDTTRALKIKGLLGYAAVKKIPSMLEMVMADGRIRGSFMWCGAQKTWRWTSKTPQWQNMKKPPKWLRPMVEEIYQTVRSREVPLDVFEFVYGPAYEIIASMARYFVRYPERMILDLDFSSVEARILPFLIQCQRIMDKIRTGEDIYEATGRALEITLKEKHKVPFSINRDTAKTIVLATQFQGGWHAVFTATGQTWKREWCETAVKIVRQENPEFPVAWRAFQDAFVTAFQNPNKWVEASKYVKFGYATKGPFPRMLMKLPSGRNITYPYPACSPITMVKLVADRKTEWVRLPGHLDDEEYISKELNLGDPFLRPKGEVDNWFHTYELSFYGHVDGSLYGRVNTYGGDLLQSATQGTGADLLAYGAIQAEARGFEPFFLVHDQALAADDGRKDEFEEAMCSIPDWFKGFPLEADADVVRSYCKND